MNNLSSRLLIFCMLLVSLMSRGAWLNETDSLQEADFAVLQFPASFTSGSTSPQIFGRLYEPAVTESVGPGAGVIAQVGYGPLGTDPRTNSAWQWYPASYNLQISNEDEYVGTVVFATNGTYSYTFRFSFYDGIDFTLADLNGAGSSPGVDFNPSQLGTATVTGIPPLALDIRRTATNTVVISWPSVSGAFFTLFRGSTVTNVSTPVTNVFGINGTNTVVEPISAPIAFYRLLQTAPPPTPAGLVINEVDYDTISTDTMEFIELLNTSSNTLDLSATAVVLVNGANSQEYARIPLSGYLAPGAYLVIANPAVIVAAGATIIRIPDNLVHNGAPDAIALFDLAHHRVIDALSYEGSITAGQITGQAGTFNLVEGTPLAAVDSNTVTMSLVRDPNGRDTDDANSDWVLTPTLTPGSPNTN
jgi:hypothetical protein